MLRRLISALALGGAAAALVAFPAGPAGSATPKPRVKQTAGKVVALAMNGPVVTYGVRPEQGCAKVFVWNVETEGGARVSGSTTCDAYSTSTGGGIVEVASAGNHVAWIVNQGGNTESDDTLYAATLPTPMEAQVAEAQRTGDVDGILAGDWIANLQGDGDILLTETWRTDSTGAVISDGLRLVTPAGLSKPFGGTTPIDDLSLDDRQVAIRRGTRVDIYATSGRLARSFSLAGGAPILRTILSGKLLIVRHLQDLAVYDAATGRRLRTFATTGSPRSLDADHGIVAFSRLGDVYIASLATGRTRLLARTRSEITGLSIEPTGIVFATANRIAYYPLPLVKAALAR